MTRYLLDTSICVELIRRRSPEVLKGFRRHAPEDIALSSITFAELSYGVDNSRDPIRNRESLAEFAAPLALLPFDTHAAVVYGRVRTALELVGTPIGPLDMLIAAHALSLGVTLVTNNEREFRRVKGLRIENWLKP